MKFSRWKAAGTHLAASLAIALAAACLIYFVWYPAPLFAAIGGQVLLGLIIGIDVCLGPLMTLIIYNPQKARKLIVLDLSIIALIQLAALFYGIHTAFVARPAFLVYAEDYFVAVPANTVEKEWLQAARDPQFRTLPLWGPRWAGMKPPGTIEEKSDWSYFQALQTITGMGIHYQPKYYVELSKLGDAIAQASKPLVQLRQRRPEAAPQLDHALAKIGQNPETIGFVPLRTKQQTLTVLVDNRSGAVLDTLALDPG